tara:strand:+ start:298 stop:714 length:417 start_codon:yes stop_codon:yes gene_type:complete
MECIHYTDNTAWQLLPITVANGSHTKPWGALWTSPAGSNRSWSEWCQDQEFGIDRLAVGVTLDVSLERALVINSQADLLKLDWRQDGRYKYPDWESMANRGVDVVHLTANGLDATRYELYGWDCESVVVLNSQAVSYS